MAIVTSPENLKMLDHYKEISRKLALAEGLSDDEAHALAREGKAVVWIDGGLHASEVECAQALSEMVYQMVSRTDPETMRFLNDVIILFVQANPDGQELVANWYMRNPDPTKRSTMPVFRASGTNTSATTTTATSSCATCRNRPTSTACFTSSGFRRSCTTTTRPALPAR